MTDPKFPTASFPAGAGQDESPEPLPQQLQSLRTLFIAALMALLLLSAAVDIFLFRQFWMVRKDLQATNIFLEDYQKNKEPLLNKLVAGLQALAQNHTDLTPIIEKYGIKPSVNSQGTQAISTPHPAAGKTGK